MASWWIDSIEVNGGFIGEFSARLPRGLTCVIGPRGSGKSTLTEAVRLAMGCPGTSKGSKDLQQFNLSEALITVRTKADVDGTGYVVRRTGRQPPLLATYDGKPVTGVDLERGTFLPLDAYSSNEIEAIADESLGAKRRSLLDELRAKELLDIQVSLSERRRALESNRDAIRAARERVSSLREQAEELADARARLAAMPAPPTDEVGESLLAANRQQQANHREIQVLDERLESLKSARTSAVGLAEQLVVAGPVATATDPSPHAEILHRIDSSINATIESFRRLAEGAAVAVDAVVPVLLDLRGHLTAAHETEAAALAELQAKHAAAGAVIQQRAATMQRVARLEELERQAADASQSLVQLQAERKRLKGEYLLERERLSSLREQVAASLQHEAGPKVRVRVLRNADSYAYQQQLMLGLQGARVRNHEDIMAALLRFRPEELAQMLAEGTTEDFASQTLLGMERARKILESLREKVDPMQLEVSDIDDRVCIELNVASAAEPNFKDASELSRGQKCTAILPLLLARRDTPLIVDQPEDNLDNHFIYETVVDTIRRLKQRRQMVFITHNANIPVLGEAELVIVLDSDGRRGFIKKAGSVDQCRGEIIDLLEGGEEAFELRRRRYGKQ